MHEERLREPVRKKELERLAATDGVERSYGPRGILDPSSYGSHILARFRNDPELDVSYDDLGIIADYLDRQGAGYGETLNGLLEKVAPLSSSTRLSIAIPAYKEGRNIYQTLSQYAKLAHPDTFEVVILENHPKGTARDDTAQEIGRFRTEHPEMNVVPLYKEFDEKCIGNVRKLLTDAILERKRRADRHDSLIIVSNDADLEHIAPRYVELFLEAFDHEPRLDAIGGGIDHSNEAFQKFPLMHATMRFINYFEAVQRRLDGEVRLSGRNSAFRSGTLAAIGGYNERAEIAEDLEIGWLTAYARHNETNRLKYLHNAWVESNPRREIESVLARSPLVRRYDGFVSNERIYDIPIEQLMETGQDFSEDQFRVEIQAIYDHYRERSQGSGGWMPDATFTAAFDRAMRFSGLSYRVENERVLIEDMSLLTRGLENYAADTEVAS